MVDADKELLIAYRKFSFQIRSTIKSGVKLANALWAGISSGFTPHFHSEARKVSRASLPLTGFPSDGVGILRNARDRRKCCKDLILAEKFRFRRNSPCLNTSESMAEFSAKSRKREFFRRIGKLQHFRINDVIRGLTMQAYRVSKRSMESPVATRA